MVVMKKATKSTTKSMNKKTSLSANPAAVSGKRYALINKATGKMRRGAETRAEARVAKRSSERIWDVVKSAYIR